MAELGLNGSATHYRKVVAVISFVSTMRADAERLRHASWIENSSHLMNTTLPDFTRLREPVSADAASGEDLRYGDRYIAMEAAAQRRSEQQFGETVYEATEPNWDDVATIAIELAEQTHDLRVGVSLSQALLRRHGILGFAVGLELLSDWVVEEWETVHPTLDPDDGDEAIERTNVLFGLCDEEKTLDGLKSVELASGRGLGECTLHDVRETQLCEREPNRECRYGLHEIHAIFIAEDRDVLCQTLEATARAERSLAKIADFVLKKTGSRANFDSLLSIINEIASVVSEYMPEKRENGPKSVAELESTDVTETDMVETASDSEASTRLNMTAGGGSETLEFSNREDVVRILTAICRYYEKSEPSSPVPLFLRRTLKLVEMDFLDIVRTLTPDGLADISRWVECENASHETTVS